MQMCKWHWECCGALLGNMTPLGRLSGRPQLFVELLTTAQQLPEWHMHAPTSTYLPHALIFAVLLSMMRLQAVSDVAACADII